MHYEKQVLDMNPAAEAAGARIGMALSEAKALLQGGSFIAWEEEPYREAQEAWLRICEDYTDVIEPEFQNTAYLDFSGHPDPAAIVWRLQKELFEKLGWKTRTGIAGTKWIAKVAETVNGDGELPLPYLEPCENPIRFLSGLPTKYLLPVPEQDRMRLRFLGYKKIGEISAVPLYVLREQFGDEGLLIHQAVHGGVQQRVQAVYPRDAASFRISFPGGVEMEEPLQQGLVQLAEGLSEILREKDLQGSELSLVLHYEEGGVCRKSRKFVKPMQSARAILAGLRLVYGSAGGERGKGKGETLITEIRARMTNLRPAEKFQRELNGAQGQNERQSTSQAAFQHIRTVFGDHAIEIAGERKESRRKRVLRSWKDATGWS